MFNIGWLVVSWALMVGYAPQQQDGIVRGNQVLALVDNSGGFLTELSLSADAWDFVHIGAFVKTYEFSNHGLSFLPFRADYGFDASVYRGPLELGIRHECDHGVDYGDQTKAWYYRGSTEVYLLFSGKTKL